MKWQQYFQYNFAITNFLNKNLNLKLLILKVEFPDETN